MGVEVTLDEADKKAREGWDPLAVKQKDPKYHYRWLNKNKLNMARKIDFLGYEIVPASEAGVALNDSTRMKKGADVANQIEVGDLVLARIPREMHEAYRKENIRKVIARTQAVTQAYKNAVNHMGGGNVAFEEHSDGRYSGSYTEADFRSEIGKEG